MQISASTSVKIFRVWIEFQGLPIFPEEKNPLECFLKTYIPGPQPRFGISTGAMPINLHLTRASTHCYHQENAGMLSPGTSAGHQFCIVKKPQMHWERGSERKDLEPASAVRS